MQNDPRSPVQYPQVPPHADPTAPASNPAGGLPPRPPASSLPPPPPLGGGDARPSTLEPPQPKGGSRRRPRAVIAGIALLAAAVGGAGGALAGAAVSDGGTTAPPAATSSTSTATVADNNADAANVVKPVLEEVEPSVVTIQTEGTTSYGPFGRNVPFQAAGTGMIVREDGLIVTNAHVVEGADTVTVTLADGTSYEASVIGSDSSIDVAVLQIDADVSNLPTVTFAEGEAEVGETVIAIGNALALGEEPTVTVGIVSAIDRSIATSESDSMEHLVQTDAAINSGNSGGPLVDMHGEVVGMNTAVVSDAQNIGFAVSAATIVQAISDLTA
jgi:S1-C subfamily serine protease